MSSIVTYLVNDEIKNNKVQVVQEGLSEVISLDKALDLASEVDLDLVEVSEKDGVSICKLMDYSKYIYNQKKKQKESNAKNKKEVVKEYKFGPNIAEHDLKVKAKSILSNLDTGCKVKVLVIFKGREVYRIDSGLELLNKFLTYLPESVDVVKLPYIEGRNYVMELKQGKQ